MYKIFKIDTCFDQYAANYDYVGGESVQDILDHFNEIYPSTEIPIDEENLEDYLDEDPNLKPGDVLTYPYFENEQLDEFNKSLDKDNNFKRIEEIPHMFTDTPYVVLDGFGYIE